MYNFTKFAVQLNELEANIAPTDSRLRPDIRHMEENNWDQADVAKVILEDKQRKRLKEIETEPCPVWFKQIIDPYLNEKRYEFTNEYWDCKSTQDWKKCPDLF